MTGRIQWRRAAVFAVTAVAAALALAGSAAAAGKAPAKPKPAKAQPVTKVELNTTRGKIVLAVHPEWSPLGAAHFLELVKAGFYNGAPWFRVIDGFVAQCGVAASPEMNKKWMDKTIQDEPLVQGNKRGMVAFGKSGAPNSRSTHIFINLADNTKSLDPQGFSCFAEVISGMDVADKLTRCEYQDQGGLGAEGGMKSFKAMFPKADYIKTAKVTGTVKASSGKSSKSKHK
jgi:cyclophilin family peptidyl-prolyl cis-trans isomerase